MALPPVQRLVREFVLDVRPAQNLLVLKTIIGSAQPVASNDTDKGKAQNRRIDFTIKE